LGGGGWLGRQGWGVWVGEGLKRVWKESEGNWGVRGRRKIKFIEGNAKCRHLTKLTCKGTLRQVFNCLRPGT
jgi:hypothetical protein